MVIPSVPVQNLEGVLERLAAYLMPGASVVDVSSVKTIPVDLMVRLLPPHCDILATHPLFGPQSGARGISGLPMVVWPVWIADERYRSVRRFLEITLKLDVQEISPEVHDKEMAYVQALTFFVGRALGEIQLPDTPLKTKMYEHLLEVMRVVESDTPELFRTIQTFNPYASRVRRAFIQELDGLEGGLELKE